MESKNVRLNVEVSNKEELFAYAADILLENEYIRDKDLFVEDLFQRENISTTYIGNGVAIPHTRSKAVVDTDVAFIRTTEKLEWGEEGDKADIFIFIIVSTAAKATKEQITILSSVAKRLVVEGVTESLRQAKTADEVIEILDI